MLKSVADRAGMSPAKVHRYLVSFCRAGYVRQDQESGRYRLGPAAVRLGQAALAAVPTSAIARPILRDLVSRHDFTAFLAVWTPAGPRIVLQEREAAPLAIAAHVGSLYPLLTSSTGRTFTAWLPSAEIENMVVNELEALASWPVEGCPRNRDELDTILSEIRTRRMERATGQLSAGVYGLSAPIFAADDRINAVISVLGSADRFDISWEGPVAQSLRAAAESITSKLRGKLETPT